jgi:hypothetical protein
MPGYPGGRMPNEMLASGMGPEEYPYRGVTIGAVAVIRPGATIYCEAGIGAGATILPARKPAGAPCSQRA